MKRTSALFASLLLLGIPVCRAQNDSTGSPLAPELTGILTNMPPTSMPVYVPQAIKPTPAFSAPIMVVGQTNFPQATPAMRRPLPLATPTPNTFLRNNSRSLASPIYPTTTSGTTNTVSLPTTLNLYPPLPTISTNGIPSRPNPWPQQNPALRDLDYKW